MFESRTKLTNHPFFLPKIVYTFVTLLLQQFFCIKIPEFPSQSPDLMPRLLNNRFALYVFFMVIIFNHIIKYLHFSNGGVMNSNVLISIVFFEQLNYIDKDNNA